MSQLVRGLLIFSHVRLPPDESEAIPSYLLFSDHVEERGVLYSGKACELIGSAK
ncbi:MAG TPA: hypothetical protein VGK99_08875 [Acidobacteriota bacterium]